MHLNIRDLRPDLPLVFSLHVLQLKYLHVLCSMCISFTARFSHVHLIVLTVFVINFKPRSSSLCSVSPFLAIPSLLGPNVLLSTLFLNPLNGWLYNKREVKFQRYKQQLVKCIFVHFNPCVSG